MTLIVTDNSIFNMLDRGTATLDVRAITPSDIELASRQATVFDVKRRLSGRFRLLDRATRSGAKARTAPLRMIEGDHALALTRVARDGTSVLDGVVLSLVSYSVPNFMLMLNDISEICGKVVATDRLLLTADYLEDLKSGTKHQLHLLKVPFWQVKRLVKKGFIRPRALSAESAKNIKLEPAALENQLKDCPPVLTPGEIIFVCRRYACWLVCYAPATSPLS